LRRGEPLVELTGARPLVLTIEMGIEKLRRDYSHALLATGIYSYISEAPFSGVLLSVSSFFKQVFFHVLCFTCHAALGRDAVTALIWSGLVWSGLVWSGLVWSGPVRSGPVRSGPVSSCMFSSGFVSSDLKTLLFV
jgi:hypothetical protein